MEGCFAVAAQVIVFEVELRTHKSTGKGQKHAQLAAASSKHASVKEVLPAIAGARAFAASASRALKLRFNEVSEGRRIRSAVRRMASAGFIVYSLFWKGLKSATN